MTDPIAIVGVAGIFPGARSASAYWDNVLGGVDSISDAPANRWDPVFFDADSKGADRFYTRRGGFVDDVATFDPLAFGIMPVALEGCEPDQLLALAAAAACLRDAGQVHEELDPRRVAVLLGRGGYVGDGVARLDQRVRTAQQLVEVLRSVVPGIDEKQLARVKAEFQDSLGPERPEGSIGLVPNLAASRIANRFDFQGPAYTVDAACASSLIAVDQAVDLLRSGRSDLVLAGGVHHCHDLTLWSVFSQLRALSPSGGIRPFSGAADGILIGEGTGLLALRRLSDAERDGARVYAVIAGTGVASDGRASSLMNPRAEGQVHAVEAAWRASGLDPADVGLIEAHGTATPVGDRTELETLRTVFGPADSRRRVGLGSVKSMIGHAMPAAGAAGLIKAALAVHHGVLPPTLHAEEPHEALLDTRFRLVAGTEPWESDGPRLAGVNAFGFGGINAHVVLAEAPGQRSGAHASYAPTAPPEADEEVLLLAGRDAADLLAQLDAWTPGARTLAVPTGGPARLAVVAPDARRLTLARKVLERGTPFRGRNDVWFDPAGVLTGGGKVAFLFPGVEPEFDPRVDDVAAQLGLSWPGLPGGTGLQDQGHGIVAVGRLLADALERLGIRPDAIAGHSLGEWTGQIVSRMIPPEHIDEFLGSLRPDSITVSDVVFLALGCGADVAAELVDGLDDAHVSHDNCPHQSVACAPAGVIEQVAARARQRKVLAQELPFRSGFHSPLFAPLVAGMAEQFGSIPLQAAEVPLWSATTVAPYPDDPAGITELAGRHLVEPVRFRQLAQRLVAEGFRAFVQVGTGSLTGFLDDTLRDQDVLTVSANSTKHSGVGQLRRVAAALWSAGADVDFTPLGHRRPARHSTPAPASTGRPLTLGSPLVRGLTPLDLPTAVGLPEVAAGTDPVLSEFQLAVREAAAAAQEVLAASHGSPLVRGSSGFEGHASPTNPELPRLAGDPSVAPAPVATSRQSVRRLAVDEQPWWRDHAFYGQPAGWPCLEDEFPLVPMTAILEMLAEEAEALVPGTVTTAIESVRAFKWLAVEPAVEVTVRASVDAAATAAAPVGTTVVRCSVDGHARAVVRLAARHPGPPMPTAKPVTGHLDLPCAVDRIYADGHLFHGPQYQGIRAIDVFGTDGIVGRLESQPAPGALLDNAGQLFGLWVASAVDRDKLVLPTSIERIGFHGPHPAPGTPVDCVVNCTSLTDTAVRADLELSVAGRVWCRIEGWEDRRFQSDDRLFSLLLDPRRLLAEEQPGGWVLVREGWPDSASRDVVMRRFLGSEERAVYQARNPRAQRSWLVGRIAAKDAVRRLLAERGGEPLFPVEVQVLNEESGRPVVAAPQTPDLRVSIAHSGGLGVALARVGVDVGIDVELVAPRASVFESAALSSAEHRLLTDTFEADGDLDRDRELTRWWAAKEAAAKRLGTGLQGRPRDFEVVAVAGDHLRVGATWVATRSVHHPARSGTDGAAPQEYVVAWTLTPDADPHHAGGPDA